MGVGPEEVVSYQMDGLSFGIYSSDEIKKLSVKEISNPQSFDALMHPTYGGLYDPALGAIDRDDVCETCGLSSIHCPGHMGHISLPLPIYTPLLFKHLIKVLKVTCFQCKHLLMAEGRSYVLQQQMAALEHGLLCAAAGLQDIYDAVLAEHGAKENLAMMENLRDKVDHFLEEQQQEELNRNVEGEMKNVTECRQNLVKSFLRGEMCSPRNCPHCKTPVRALRDEHFSKVYFQQGMKKNQALRVLEYKKKQEQLRKQQMEEGIVEEAELDDEAEMEKKKEKEKEVEALMRQAYLTPVEARLHLQQVWRNDSGVLGYILGALCKKDMDCATDVFFLDVMPVAPSRFRPISKMKDKSFENSQTQGLVKVIESSHSIRQILAEMQGKKATTTMDAQSMVLQANKQQASQRSLMEKLQAAWIKLQTSANVVVDSDMDKLNKDNLTGIKQILEKKEGLFRKHMMGKRVDYACRSVISPDPYIDTNQIGIPMVFAKKLTYAESVTPINFHVLKRAVINGPAVHPGALYVINEDGSRVKLSATDKAQREGIAKQLLTPTVANAHIQPNKMVERHLEDGDMLLLNRQPTLHRPSIQAHRARVLPKEKTLRLHYANCKAYNADFDGDEMNAHFPQNPIAKAEAMELLATDYQYLVPKDGTPLAGLIQDHMVGGVSLMVRGRFLTRADYHQLVYSALPDLPHRIRLLPPALIKPQRLWSGKQVVSTVLLNLVPKGRAPPNVVGKAKIGGKNWIRGEPRAWTVGGKLKEDEMSESEVIIRCGELLVGVMDKGHYGNTPYGLVHCFYELYGGKMAGQLLSCLARLFTSFLQLRGFTLGVKDILVTKKGDKARRKSMRAGAKYGPQVAASALNVAEDEATPERLQQRLQEAHFGDGGEMKDLDLSMKGKTDEIQNEIAKSIMPEGLLQRFPDNNLQLMVQSGAKGSSVNCMQISCLLGQIELEGRRPAIMMSGRSLPSFQPYDPCPRAGGFIDGRFLTGIRPQEYFFHCMAGREGLVDTAVKTSRSGYLQRCIIKHLEGLKINYYNRTVIDSDGSVVQFNYGEDGLDICKIQFLNKKQFPFLIQNRQAILSGDKLATAQQRMDTEAAPQLWKKMEKWEKKHANQPRQSPFTAFSSKKLASVIQEVDLNGEAVNGRSAVASRLVDMWQNLAEEKKQKYRKQTAHQPDPVLTQLWPNRHFGSMSERFHQTVQEYCSTNPDQLLCTSKKSSKGVMSAEEFANMLYLRNKDSLVPPGEPVGLLAAQSIGEPSTQMTLNTFHFAGRGEMNVTLGIPRLREILMVASENIRTPNMDVPVLEGKLADAQKLQLKLNRVFLSQVLEDVTVTEKLHIKPRKTGERLYTIRFQFLPHAMYCERFCLTPPRIMQHMERKLIPALQTAIKKKLLQASSNTLLSSARVRRTASMGRAAVTTRSREEDEDISDDDQHDDDATASKRRERQGEGREYEGEDDEVAELAEDGERMDQDPDEVEEEDEGIGVDDDRSEQEEGENGQTDTTAPVIKRKKKKSLAKMDEKRRSYVVANNNMVVDYTYDAAEELWCQVTFSVALSSTKTDMTSVIEAEARKSIVHQVPGITRCLLSKCTAPGEEGMTRLKTEGVNIGEMYKYDQILDLKKLYTNNVHAIANTYGIEAASRAVVKEIRDVFAAYGIEVDYHHLSLVADYMTYEGKYKPFNRVGIESNASPLQKMSFETTMHFLKTAVISGAHDDLKSPSARLVVGKMVDGGTGSFDIIARG